MKEKATYGVGKRLLLQFLGQIIIYIIVVLLVSAAGYLWGHSKFWYADTMEFRYALFIQENWFSIFFLSIFAGCLLIAGIHIIKFAKILEKITDAVSALSRQQMTYIKLPHGLHEVEQELNQILAQMQHDRQSAREAEQRKNDMIVYMAHDLKTPLTSVIGYLTLLHDEKMISEEIRNKYLGIALRKSEHLEELINDFFEVTKYNFSNTVLTLTTVNLSVMLEQLVYEFNPLFQKKGVTCEVKTEKALMVTCDVEKMERVFDNLFKNAFNYCYENTVIYVNLMENEEKNGVVLTVQNSGKTIPKEKLEKLFEQFFRMDSSRSSKTGGTGLGLAIAREIITLHHGSISCESEKETILFTVRLPYQD